MITNPGHTVELTLDSYTSTDTRMANLHIELPNSTDPNHPEYVAALDLHGSKADKFTEHGLRNNTEATATGTVLPRTPVINTTDQFTDTYGHEVKVHLHSRPGEPWYWLEITGHETVARLNIHAHHWGELLQGQPTTAVMANWPTATSTTREETIMPMNPTAEQFIQLARQLDHIQLNNNERALVIHQASSLANTAMSIADYVQEGRIDSGAHELVEVADMIQHFVDGERSTDLDAVCQRRLKEARMRADQMDLASSGPNLTKG